MGRRKNPTSGMNVYEKENTPLAQRLSGLITDANALKDFLGVSSQAINQYKLGESRPSLENLCKIANFYGVSVDYLLGRAPPDNSTADEKLRAVSEYTGLGNTAVEKLRVMKAREQARAWTNTLSLIISDPDFEYLLSVLEGYFAEGITIVENLAMAGVTVTQKDLSIFTASNILRNIMDRVGEQFFQLGYQTSQDRTEVTTKRQKEELGE